MAKRECLIDDVSIDRHPCGFADPDVVPWRFRVPLIGEVDPLCTVKHNRFECQALSALYFLSQFTPNGVGDVDLTALQCSKPGRFIWYHPQDEFLYRGTLAPVVGECLQHQLHAGI